MSRTDPQLKVRLPLEMKERLEKASKENHRSMNAEIVARLGESLAESSVKQSPDNEGDYSADDVVAMYDELDAAVRKIAKLKKSREAFLDRHTKDEEKG